MTERAQIVIVAEDETLIRMTVAMILSEAGFEVIEAGNAAGVLKILEAKGRAIQALFSDIHMPGSMDGLQLAHHARMRCPWLLLLLASGQARPSIQEMPAGSRFVLKPYDPDHIVTHLQEMAASI